MRLDCAGTAKTAATWAHNSGDTGTGAAGMRAPTGEGQGMELLRTRAAWRAAGAAAGMLMLLAGCEDMQGANLFRAKPAASAVAEEGESSVRLVERDVEAPDVFQVTDTGLWDGRPSLGGVWVAHPDVKEPERVIIRNTANSKFVIGALFRRERANPGPVLQVSSDAAAALGMLAGAPGQLQVTALRRESVADPAAAESMSETETLAADAIEATELAPADVEVSALDGDAAPAPTPAPAAAPAPKPQAPVQSSSLDRPFIQIGIFSVEENANNTATAMRQAGMVPTVLEQNSQGKTFWRVIVGPAATASERSALLKKIKGVGFDDAYAVSN